MMAFCRSICCSFQQQTGAPLAVDLATQNGTTLPRRQALGAMACWSLCTMFRPHRCEIVVAVVSLKPTTASLSRPLQPVVSASDSLANRRPADTSTCFVFMKSLAHSQRMHGVALRCWHSRRPLPCAIAWAWRGFGEQFDTVVTPRRRRSCHPAPVGGALVARSFPGPGYERASSQRIRAHARGLRGRKADSVLGWHGRDFLEVTGPAGPTIVTTRSHRHHAIRARPLFQFLSTITKPLGIWSPRANPKRSGPAGGFLVGTGGAA